MARDPGRSMVYAISGVVMDRVENWHQYPAGFRAAAEAADRLCRQAGLNPGMDVIEVLLRRRIALTADSLRVDERRALLRVLSQLNELVDVDQRLQTQRVETGRAGRARSN